MKRISFLISIIIMLSLHIQLRGQTAKLSPSCNSPAPANFLALTIPCDGLVYTSWEKVPNNNGYNIRIYKKGDNKVFIEQKVEKDAVKAKIGGLKPNTDYIAKISTNCSATKTSTKVASYNFSTKKSNLPPVKNIKVAGSTVTWDKVQNSKGYLVLVYKNEKYEPLFFSNNQAIIPANLTPCKISVAAIDKFGGLAYYRKFCDPGEIIVSELVVMDPEPPTERYPEMSNNGNLRVSEGNTYFRGLISGGTKWYKLVINGQGIVYIRILRNITDKYEIYTYSDFANDMTANDTDNLISWSNYKIQFSNWSIEPLVKSTNSNGYDPLPPNDYQIYVAP